MSVRLASALLLAEYLPAVPTETPKCSTMRPLNFSANWGPLHETPVLLRQHPAISSAGLLQLPQLPVAGHIELELFTTT